MTDTLPQRIEAAEGPETADLLYEAWNEVAQADADFRHFACTVIDQRTGKTNAGRFAGLLEVGAFTDAALTLVPEGWDSLEILAPDKDETVWSVHFTYRASAERCTVTASGYHENKTLALLAAALRAKDQVNG